MINRSTVLKSLLPLVVASLVFLTVDALYFAPQFQGKEIEMHDITQYKGMGKDIKDHLETYDEDPQWAGRMFSGMPSYLISFQNEGVIIPKVRPVFEFLGFPANLIFMAMTCFFVMLLLWGVNPWIGIIPSLAYGLSSYLFIIIGAGHITKLVALAYAPLMLGTVFYAYRKNMWIGAACTAFVATIEIAASHPQITYYFAMILLAFFINELVIAIKKHALPRFAKVTGLLALAACLAVGANLSSLWYVNQHSSETVRGGSELTVQNEQGQNKGLDLSYATQWSYGISESLNMLIPDLMGGQSGGGFTNDGPVAKSLTKYNARGVATKLPGYWGPQPMTSGPVYIGAVMIMLAVIAMFVLSGVAKWWIVSVSAIALMLSWGHNFMWFTELFFDFLPGYNKFRTVSMILVILQWAFPFMAALVLNKLWTQEYDKKKLMGGIVNSVTFVGGVCLLLYLFSGSLFSFAGSSDSAMQLPEDVINAMRVERASMLKSDALRSLFFVLATAGLVWLFVKNKVSKWLFIALFSVLVVVDLVGVNLRYLPLSRFENKKQELAIQPTSADLEILKDTEPGFRVANFSVSIFNDATTSYFHRSVGGYHGAKLSRYQDLIERHLSKMNMQVYNMLNTKYIISNSEQGGLALEENVQRNGAVWFVQDVLKTSTPNQEIDALSNIDTKQTAVVDVGFEQDMAGLDLANTDSLATITLVDYKPNYLKYDYSSNSAQLAVFSEVYYPKGWTAYVDGEPAPYFRANYILRAMNLPKGDHTIEFKFKAPLFDTISNITLIFSLIIIIWMLATGVFFILKRYGTTK